MFDCDWSPDVCCSDLLIAVPTVWAAFFVSAFGAIRHYDPNHAHLLEFTALSGFAFSSLVWLVVALATPAPVVIQDVAKMGARRLQAKLPPEIRERIPAIGNRQ